MKRQVCYTVDISMDSDGVVMELQCECGAGTGPNVPGVTGPPNSFTARGPVTLTAILFPHPAV